MAQSDLSQQQQDEALLQKFGYKQELRRSLGSRMGSDWRAAALTMLSRFGMQ